MRVKLLSAALAVGTAALGLGSTGAHAPTTNPMRASAHTTGAVIVHPIVPSGAGRGGTRSHGATSPRIYTRPPSDKACAEDFGVAECFTPRDIRRAYGVNRLLAAGHQGEGQTIVIVDSFGSSTIANDLRHFDRAYKLVGPPSFKVLHPLGTVKANPNNASQQTWAYETTLDVEWAHAMAPKANLVLLTSPVNETEGVHGLGDFLKLEQYALNHKLGDVISQSWDATENTLMTPAGRRLVAEYERFYARAARHHITVLAGSGDTGSQNYKRNSSSTYSKPTVNFPASSPYVTAVGGTSLTMKSGRWSSEKVWNAASDGATGGGLSQLFREPSWEKKLPSSAEAQLKGRRGLPDLAWNGDPDTSILIYISDVGMESWVPIGGTSEGAPQWAGLIADINQARRTPVGWLNPILYPLAGKQRTYFHDITQGNNSYGGVAGYTAAAGWDATTGLGTPRAMALARVLIHATSVP